MADQIEAAKRRAAERAVADHFDPSFRYVGIGSGTTILYVVDAIKASLEKSAAASSTAVDERRGSLDPSSSIQFVPTGYQSRQVIVRAGLTPLAFDSLPESVTLDVAFDGADEVDDELNCIKGGGACLFQEKLVATRAKKFVCVADYRKNQSRLLTAWPAIPIEVVPLAVYSVIARLRALGSTDPKVRAGLLAKSGPDQTDQGNFIIDAKFPGPLLTRGDLLVAQKRGEEWAMLDKTGTGRNGEGRWEVESLAREIKSITGVLDVGLFVGENGYEASKRVASGGKAAHGLEAGQKPVSCYFGMQDGSVETKEAQSSY
ncbi:MAG: ribose-5-phosphate isomerase rki1 [Bathelium mastoideum]|nr:MAG: ribose-5-phosphate isomerase rki1 [Bathelium mastoideum]